MLVISLSGIAVHRMTRVNIHPFLQVCDLPLVLNPQITLHFCAGTVCAELIDTLNYNVGDLNLYAILEPCYNGVQPSGRLQQLKALQAIGGIKSSQNKLAHVSHAETVSRQFHLSHMPINMTFQ